MDARYVRAGIGAVVVVVAVVLLIVLSGGDDNKNDDKSAGTVPTVVVKNGEPVGGIQKLEYKKGDQIHFKVQSDVADEIHVHGYDKHQDVAAGGTVEFDFPATIEGVFEAELEERKEQIIELVVNP